MPGVAGAQLLEIAEHGEGLVGIAPLLQGMGQLVGRLGADRSRGGVEANGLVAARQLLQHRPQLVVDPDITWMPLLGPPQHRLGHRCRSPASFRPVPSKCRLIGPSSSNFAVLCQGLQCGSPSRLVGLIQGGAQLVAPGVGVGDAGGLARAAPLRPRPPASLWRMRRPVVQRRGQGQCHRRRASLDLRPRLGRRQAGQVDPGLAEGVGVVVVGDRAVLVVGLGRADVDQAIEQRLVALGGVQPGLDLACAGPADGPRCLDRRRLPPARQRPVRPASARGPRGSRRPACGACPPGSRPGRSPRPLDPLPGPFGPLLEVVRRAQPAQRRERQDRRRQRELDLAPPPLLDRPRHGHGTLALGRLHPLLHARQVGRDPLGHDAWRRAAGPRARPPGSPSPGRSARPRPRSRPAGPGRRPCRPGPPCGGSRSRSGP